MSNENCVVYQSKYGKVKICYIEKTITSLKRVNDDEILNMGSRSRFTDDVHNQLQEYFEGKRKNFDFSYELNGTEFQMKVWKALLDIPYGETKSYKDIATTIGNPKACRAVGMANNKNPISIVVPCHRVIGTSGKLVGYAGGLDMKKDLLEMEKNNL